MLGGKTILHVEDGVTCLLTHLTAEFIVAAVGRDHESTSMEVEKNGRGRFQCLGSRGSIDVNLDRTSMFSRLNKDYLVWMRSNASLEPRPCS